MAGNTRIDTVGKDSVLVPMEVINGAVDFYGHQIFITL